MRKLPNGWDCTIKTCQSHDPVGSEHSCNGGALESCPIASGFLTDADREALLIGRIALQDSERLPAVQAYFAGRKNGRKGR